MGTFIGCLSILLVKSDK